MLAFSIFVTIMCIIFLAICEGWHNGVPNSKKGPIPPMKELLLSEENLNKEVYDFCLKHIPPVEITTRVITIFLSALWTFTIGVFFWKIIVPIIVVGFIIKLYSKD